jgi:hypothetical protein
MALVPPVRPLPTRRTSCPVTKRTISKPEGIDPSKYPSAATRMLSRMIIHSLDEGVGSGPSYYA